MPDINLIPQEVKKEQTQQKVVKSSTISALALVGIVVAITGFYIYRTQSLKSEIKGYEASMESLRVDITLLSDIEVVARNLDMKYKTLKDVFGNRKYFSVLMTEFEKRIPGNIIVDSFGTGKNSTINISGTGTDYIAIAKFVNNLSDPSFAGADSDLQGLFTNVSLNSVNLDAQTTQARFFIVLTIDESLIKK